MRPDTTTIAIEEKYAPEEKLEIASKLATAIAEVEEIKGEKKVSDAAFNERITKCQDQISNLAKQYNKGCEVAQIGCDIRYDHPEPGKKSYVRMDTGELVNTFEMSWEEKQETIQFPLNANPADETIAQPTAEQVSEAIDSLKEETTRLCEKTPGCTLFAEHDGDCAIAPEKAEPGEAA